MNVIKIVLIVIYVIVCLVLTVIALMQSKDDEGAPSTIVGGSSNFYDQNKGRTKEGKLKKWTIILGIIFVLLSIALSIVYMM